MWDRQAVATDGDGRFTVTELSPGSYTVRAYRRGGGEGIVEGVRSGATTRIVIRPTGSIAGVVSLAGGAPERFELQLEDETSGFGRMESFFRTGGSFVLADLPAGKFKLTASAAGGSAVIDLALAEGEQRTGVDLALEGRVTLTGRVVELGAGTPIAGMTLWVSSVSGSARPTGGWDDPRRVSGGDGRFTIEGAPRGRLQVYAVPQARESSPYWAGPKVVTVPADASRFDVGDVEVVRRRVGPRERGGDLGFELADPPPDADPDAVELKVASIRPGGPAVGSGLVVGDVIVAVDRIDVRGGNSARFGALAAVPAGTVVKFALARGETIAITAGKPL